MALINCYECGKEISDTADNCIHCGAKIKKTKKNNNIENKTIIKLLIGLFVLYIFLNIPLPFASEKNISGCYTNHVAKITDGIDASLCISRESVEFNYGIKKYSLYPDWGPTGLYIKDEYSNVIFSCNVNENDYNFIECTTFRNLFSSHKNIWERD